MFVGAWTEIIIPSVLWGTPTISAARPIPSFVNPAMLFYQFPLCMSPPSQKIKVWVDMLFPQKSVGKGVGYPLKE